MIYPGLMLTKDGPKVIEFNARLGDPETQVVLPLLNADLAEICMAVAEGKLADVATPGAITAGSCRDRSRFRRLPRSNPDRCANHRIR